MGYSVSFLKCWSSPDKAPDIVFNVTCILTSAVQTSLWNQDLYTLPGDLIGIAYLPWPQTKSLIFPLKPASSYLIATGNGWGQKTLKVSWMPPSLPIPSAKTSCQLFFQQVSRTQPPLISMATILVQTTVAFHLQTVGPPSHSLLLSSPLTAPRESLRKMKSDCVLLCWTMCRHSLTKAEVLRMCDFSLLPHVSPMSHVQLLCPLLTCLQPLYSALLLFKHLDQLTVLRVPSCLPSCWLQIFAPMSSWLRDCHFYPL